MYTRAWVYETQKLDTNSGACSGVCMMENDWKVYRYIETQKVDGNWHIIDYLNVDVIECNDSYTIDIPYDFARDKKNTITSIDIGGITRDLWDYQIQPYDVFAPGA